MKQLISAILILALFVGACWYLNVFEMVDYMYHADKSITIDVKNTMTKQTRHVTSSNAVLMRYIIENSEFVYAEGYLENFDQLVLTQGGIYNIKLFDTTYEYNSTMSVLKNGNDYASLKGLPKLIFNFIIDDAR